MDHADHVRLLRDGVTGSGGVWADLGSGTGAFTLALAELLGPGKEIYSVDRDRAALATQQQALRTQFPDTTVHCLVADFTAPLVLPPLDGLLMANSLHFLRQKEATLRQLRAYLKPGGRLILVEYDTDRGNMWVPYPLSYRSWEALSHRVGFEQTRLLTSVPSRFLGRIFSAVSV